MTAPRHMQVSEETRRELLLIVAAAREGRTLIKGFGIFFVSTRRARQVRNPQTKELMRIPATRELRFRMSKDVRERLNPRRKR
ncbi:MAG: HU family DNA-binding protein [Archangium sp.]|nr:HU family DNA-binding protein [Archangium sp.]